MGSKNLKAIACHGTKGVTVNDPKTFMAVVKETHEKLAGSEGRKGLTQEGTLAMIDAMEEWGGLPTRNFNEVQFKGTGKINPNFAITKNEHGHVNLITNKACFGCTIACGRIAHIDPEHFTVVNRPQYLHASGGLEY
jgi:aldehyde:ferredoxin oxidoreductase